MPIKYIRAVPVTAFPLDSIRVLPAQISTTAPLQPVQPPRHMEFPQEMSLTVPKPAIPPAEAVNDSTPAPESRPERPADQAEPG